MEPERQIDNTMSIGNATKTDLSRLSIKNNSTLKEGKHQKPQPNPSINFELPGYIFERELARGGMGIVYLAWQTNLSRQTAIKMLGAGIIGDSRYRLRFMAEAEATASLKHRHVAQVYDFGVHDDQPYLAMEYCSGGTLAEKLTGSGRLAAIDAAQLVSKLCGATQAAHDLGIIHRDIKPGNVIFDSEGEPKLVDFGLAKRQGGSDLTHTQAILGTPAYMAPEQARGETKFVGPAADIYSLGVILYECLTGKRPFEHDDTMALLRMVADQVPERPRISASVPRDLELICLKCLEKDPARRYSTAAALESDLKAFIAGEPVTARPLPTHEQVARWAKRHPAVTTATCLGLLGTVVLLLMIGYNNRQLHAALNDAKQQATRAEKSEHETRLQQQVVIDLSEKRRRDIDNMVDKLSLRLKSESNTLAQEFLKEILAVNEKMLSEDSDNGRLLMDMAKRYSSLGTISKAKSDTKEQRSSYGRARSLLDQRLASTPNDREALLESASVHYQLADMAQADGQWKEAEQLYRTSAERYLMAGGESASTSVELYWLACKELAEEQIGNAGDIATMLKGLASLEQKAQPLLVDHADDAYAWYAAGEISHLCALGMLENDSKQAAAAFQRSLERHRQAKQIDSAGYSNYFKAVHNDYAQFAMQTGDHGLLATLAEQYAEDFAEDYDGSYYAATRLCHAIEILPADDSQLNPLKEQYTHAAITYLKKCVSEGFSDRCWFRLDWELDAIKATPQFLAFLDELDTQYNNEPLNAADYYTSLIGIYNYTTFYDDDISANFANRFRASGQTNTRDWYWTKANDLVERFPDAAESIDFLYVVIGYADPDRSPLEAQQIERSVKLASRFTGMPDFSKIADKIVENLYPQTEPLLIDAYGKANEPHRKAKYLKQIAKVLEKRAAEAEIGSDEQNKAYDKAIRVYEKLMTEFGTVPDDVYATMAEAATEYSKQLRTTSIGRTAPSISGVDIDGEPMASEEFLGKVQIIDFWASWCPPCREMFPTNSKIVAKYANRPFVWLGVNSDPSESLDRVREVTLENGVNWRSWHDADDNIGNQWNIRGIPRVYLLSHEGVILKTWEGLGPKTGEEIDQAIEQALRAIELPENGP